MRTLTSPAATQAARKDGPRPIHILEVAFDSGTVYWADEDLTSPVTASGRVHSWGELQLDAVPGKSGGNGTLSITVTDVDHSLKQEAATPPGFQRNDATLYLWFAGTTWPDDRITLFAGVLTSPCEWDEVSGLTKLTMKGREVQYDPSIGFLMTTVAFPEIDCKACENEIVPIVYGNTCRRVPACVVNRPGVAQLAVTLTSLPPSSTLTIDKEAAAAFFTEGASTTLIVGFPGRFERVVGSFGSSGASVFTMTSRGSIYAQGSGSSGIATYASGGMTYLTIPKSALPDNGDASRGGYPLLLRQDNLSWIAVIITHWWAIGDYIVVCIRGSDMDVSVNANWQLLNSPGSIPQWPAGTPVSEEGTWTYVANWLPSKSVTSVEIRSRMSISGGDSRVKWAVINPAYYTVDLDDRTYNGNIGRDPSDPGITTITLDFSPTALGADDETIYVTMQGITDDNTTSGDVLEDPALVCQNLLSNPFIGNIPLARIDTASFTAAASDLVTRCAFALMDEKRSLNEIVADIAHQAGCLFFWDGGQATIKRLSDEISTEDSVFTINNSNRRAQSLKVTEIDVKELITEMIGKFRRTCPDDEQRIVRGSEATREDTSGNASSAGGNAGKTDFGVQRDEMDFWAFQFPSSVARNTEEWCRRKLNTNRTVSVDLYLDAIALQPGDVVLFDITDGAGQAILDNVPGRIRSTRTRLGNSTRGEMPSITITADVQDYSYAVTVIEPDDEGCAGQNTSGGRARGGSRRLSLRSSPTGKLHVFDTPQRAGTGTGIGSSGGEEASDPTTDYNPGTIPFTLGTAEQPDAESSSFS